MRDIVVFTAVFGGYDDVAPCIETDGVRHIAYTERDEVVPGWKFMLRSNAWGNPRLTARFYKTLGHCFFPECDFFIWQDANVTIKTDPHRLVDEWLEDADIAVPHHPGRNCAYAEAIGCIKKRKDKESVLREQMAAYQAAGLPKDAGLGETRIVVRRNNAAVAEFGELWWREVEHHSVRDQVSFPYVAWLMRSKLEVRYMPDVWIPKHPWFGYREHGG